ncbi:hypothetical protein [Ranavirus maximus]|uniref:Uncharacterized protein n=1 Tax=Ranavirus maximus TaxID=1887314 RepID=A0A1B2IUF8_FRG3V|nr:hypothetical protein BGV90_gp096 [Ranavirus maximus]ANZ57221.1 hypothetical protein [Ranavirus maximus]
MANTQNSVMDFVDTNVIEVVRGQGGLYHVILEKATELAIPDEYILEDFYSDTYKHQVMVLEKIPKVWADDWGYDEDVLEE